MRSGLYRAKVTIYTVPWTTDTDAGVKESPVSSFAVRWARVIPSAGKETWRNEILSAETTHVVELREYTAGVTPKMRVVWGSRTLEIISVRHDEMRHRETTLECRELIS